MYGLTVVTSQPREPQHKLEVGQVHKLKGNLLRVLSMNPDAGVVEMGDRSSRTAINEFDWNRMRVGLGLQQMLPQKGGVQKSAGGTRIDQCQDRDGEKTKNEDVNGKGKVAARRGGGKGVWVTGGRPQGAVQGEERRGGTRQVEVQREEANTREPACQSMVGL